MQACIYCLVKPKETKDHVPPKGLFPEPRPSDLITVPACSECNKGFSADDDYFQNLALEWAASESKDGKKVVEKRFRSMKRKKGRNVWRPIFASVKPVEIYSSDGWFLANSLEFALDTKRLLRTIDRMIRGLYFEVTKTPLPLGDYTRSMLYSDYMELHKNEGASQELINFFPRLDGRVLGNDTFEFRYLIFDQARHLSFWYLEFYQRFAFVGTTGELADSQGASGSQNNP